MMDAKRKELSGKRVLVVEDDPSIAIGLRFVSIIRARAF